MRVIDFVIILICLLLSSFLSAVVFGWNIILYCVSLILLQFVFLNVYYFLYYNIRRRSKL